MQPPIILAARHEIGPKKFMGPKGACLIFTSQHMQLTHKNQTAGKKISIFHHILPEIGPY